MGALTPRLDTALRIAAALALAALSAGLFARTWQTGGRVGDEEDYRRAACHLLESGTLSLDPLDAPAPRPSAYREPLYPLALAAFAAARPEPLCAAPLEPGRPLPAPIAWAQWALLAAAAAAAGLAAARRTSESVAWLAGAAVACSPALAFVAATCAAEALAAPLALAATLALAAALDRPGGARAAAAGLAVALLVLARIDGLVLAALGALLLPLAARRAPAGPARRRALAAAGLYLLALAAPLAIWQARNLGVAGAPVLVEARSGAVLLVRAELDRALAGRRLAAALAWTPIPWLAERAEGRADLDPILRPVWSQSRHYFVRARQRWAELSAASTDRAEAGRRAAAEARAVFLGDPLGHLASSTALFWRGLFVERDPELLRGWGIAALWALALWAAAAAGAGRALARRDLAAAAPALAVYAGALAHSLLTESLPRFGLPALPALALAAALAFARPPAGGLAGGGDRDTIGG